MNEYKLCEFCTISPTISGRHVGAHPDGHKHGVSIQISINLGKTSLRISLVRNIAVAWIIWRGALYIYLLSFPRFWTLSIEISISIYILNGVTLKTSNSLFQTLDQWGLKKSGRAKSGISDEYNTMSVAPPSPPPPALFWSSPLTKSLEQAGYFLIAGLRVLLAAKCFLQ